MSYNIGGTGAVDADGVRVRQGTAGGDSIAAGVMKERRKDAIAASTSISSRYRVLGGTGSYKDRWMRVTPVRVG